MSEQRLGNVVRRKGLIIINFALAAAACLYLAVPDVGRVSGLGAHALVMLILAVGMLCFTAFVLLLRSHSSAALWALEASIGTALVSALLLVGQWIEDPKPGRLALWILALAVQILIAWDLLRLGARPRYPRSVATVVGLSAAFTVFQFWYASDYEPRHASGQLSLTTSMQLGAERDGLVALYGTITAENSRSVRLRAPASVFYVVALDIGSREDYGEPLQPLKSVLTCEFDGGRDYTVDAILLVDAGRLYRWDAWFEPKSKSTFRFVTYMPAAAADGRTYDVAVLKTFVTIAQGRLFRDVADSYKWEVLQSGLKVRESWRLESGSRFADLLHADRRVTVEWDKRPYEFEECPEVQGSDFPSYWLTVSGRDGVERFDPDSATRLGRYFRIATTSAGAHLSLWRAAGATQAPQRTSASPSTLTRLQPR